MLREMGYCLFATKNTFETYKAEGIEVSFVYKPLVKRDPNVLNMMRQGKIDLVINVPDSMDSQAVTDGFEMRRSAVDAGVGLVVDFKTAQLLVLSLHRKYMRER